MNPLRGEATAQLGDCTLTLVLDNGAWCEIEEVLDDAYLDIYAKLVTRQIVKKAAPNRIMRVILWGATREHHPELTLPECGDLIMLHPELHGPLGEVILRSTRSMETAAPGEAKPATKPAPRKRKSAAN